MAQNDDTYVISFQGSLSDSAVRPLIATASLQKAVVNLGGGASTVTGTATVTVRTPGSADPAVNQVQFLSVTATSGTYKLQFHVNGVTFTTAPIAYNASAEQVRQTIQNAIAVGESIDPNVQAFLVDKLDVMVQRYPSGYLNQDVYVLNFQGELRKEQFGPGVDTVSVIASTLLGGTAIVSTRMDGINYYGFETVNIATGSGSEVFNVQGTTSGSNGFTGLAQTNITLDPQSPLHPNGNDRVYLSSNAEPRPELLGRLRLPHRQPRRLPRRAEHRPRRRPPPPVPERRGVDASRHLRRSPIPATPATMTRPRLVAGADIYLTAPGLPGDRVQDVERRQPVRRRQLLDGQRRRHDPDRRYEAERRAADDDDPRHGPRQRQRHGQPDRRRRTASSSSRPPAAPRRATRSRICCRRSQDNDTVDAHLSTLPLVIIGGWGNDTIRGGQGNDIILGDSGIVQYAVPGSPDTLLAQFGFGGRGDVIDAQGATLGTPIDDPRWVFTYVPDMALGGNDTIYGNGGEDILVGGAAGDRDRRRHRRRPDLRRRGAALPPRRAPGRDRRHHRTRASRRSRRHPDLPDDRRRPTRRTHSTAASRRTTATRTGPRTRLGRVPDHEALPVDVRRSRPGGTASATTTSRAAPATTMIFGQLGNDTIQGDGSIDYSAGAAACTGVGPRRWNTRPATTRYAASARRSTAPPTAATTSRATAATT